MPNQSEVRNVINLSQVGNDEYLYQFVTLRKISGEEAYKIVSAIEGILSGEYMGFKFVNRGNDNQSTP